MNKLTDLEIIQRFKIRKTDRILDVGGSMHQHDEIPVDTLVDILRPEDVPYFPSKLKAKHFQQVDITKCKLPFKNNEFDFCLCTHTLEDLYNPFQIIEEMSRVAKRGYITTPSMGKDMEFSHLNMTDWLTGCRRTPGQTHHKWFLVHDNNHLQIIPKNYGILYTPEFQVTQWSGDDECQYYWKDTISYTEIKDVSSHELIGVYRGYVRRNKQFISNGVTLLFIDNPYYLIKETIKLLLKKGQGFVQLQHSH